MTGITATTQKKLMLFTGRAHPELAEGSLVVTHPALMPDVKSILPKSQPMLLAQYSSRFHLVRYSPTR